MTNLDIISKYYTSRKRNCDKREVYSNEVIILNYKLLLKETKTRFRAIAN